jgi:hypothetical protein
LIERFDQDFQKLSYHILLYIAYSKLSPVSIARIGMCNESECTGRVLVIKEEDSEYA